MPATLNYIDLFAGAGGLSEGFKKAGFNPIAHVEIDSNACKTLKTRTAFHFLKKEGKEHIYNQYIRQEITVEQLYENVPRRELNSVLNVEISADTLDGIFKDIDKLKGDQKIDLIVGGPPCQAYSLVGRARMGHENVKNDKRYVLYRYYGEFLRKYKPLYFVFENVQGLLSAEQGQLVKTIESFLEECGYKVKYKLIDTSDYGVLQKRKRVILIGKRGTKDFEYPELKEDKLSKWNVSTALFKDLKKINAGDEKILKPYASKNINSYLADYGIRNGLDLVSQHIARPHIQRDLDIYSIAIDKWINYNERLKYNDLPKALKTHNNEKSFLDRFKVVDPYSFSHTVVAHIGKDGHYFIYPDINNPRSISVREAARIQSFPDDYFFEGGRTSAFKQIGNAVPPQMAKIIADAIKSLY